MNKKLISMLLVGAAFTACTDDEFVDGYSNNQQVTDGLVQDLILSVSMDADVQSRAAYAGSTEEEGAKSLFSNFYLEPAYDGSDLDLSDNTALKGDMLGFCLTNGANAITNLPFYIAGYNTSDLNAGEAAKDSVWVFATQDDQENGYNSLYDLGLDLDKVTPAVADKALIDAAKTSLAATSKDAEMQSKDLDLRKGIVRSNAGVMTGKYVAYFPYDSEFVDPAGVPIKKLGKAIEDKTEAGNAFFAATQADAIQKADFYNKLFAISQTTLDVNGGTKAGKVSLAPRTGGIFFRLYNTAEVKEKPNREIKRITVETTTPETTDFILEGNVPMNDLSKVVATKTTDLIGVAFIKDSVAAGTTAENAKWVMIPVYPNSTKGVKITLYTTDGQAAVATKQGGPQMGAVKTYKLNIDSLEFKPVTRKIFTANDFLAEMTTAGELELMDDITVTLNADLDKKLNIKGAKTLTINAGSYGITADSLNLHDAAGSKLVLKGFANVAKTVTADSIALVNSQISPTAINAAKVEVDANSTITLKEAEITSLINNGTVTVTNADKKNVVVGTFDNNKAASTTISATGTLTATTFNNNAGATLLTKTTGSGDAAKYGKLAATTINNAAKIPAGTNPVTPEVAAAVITNNGILAGTISNAGSITWGTQAIDVTINNTGALTIGNACKFTGSLTNAGEVTISAEVSGDGGSITNNTNGKINVTGKLYLNTTTLAINAGTVKVSADGLINGSTNITVAEGADYVKAVVDELNLTSALETEGVYAKFTGVELAPTSALNIQDSISTAKKIFITRNDVTFAKGITLTGGLESTVALTFNKTADITGDIASEGALTFTGAAALVGDMTLKADATFNETSTLTGNLKVDGAVILTAKNLKITKDVTIAKSKLLRMGSNTKVSINGTVINNGTFTLNGAAVTCTGIETGKDARWDGQPLY